MQQRQMVAGFSEFKDILIRKYKINEDRKNIRLHFTFKNGDLIIHNYKKHDQLIVLATVGANGAYTCHRDEPFARGLIELAIKEKMPADFLNAKFNLCGFFRF